MKSNKKSRKTDERAVSAVIGVILMVAITVAIAATVYVYVNGMVVETKRTPSIACIPNNTDNELQITRSDPDVAWSDINITILANGTTTHFQTKTGTVTAGDTINVGSYLIITGNKVTVALRYNPTNTLIGTWTVS
jgi:archaeal type IV pilus assembly protein PilA